MSEEEDKAMRERYGAIDFRNEIRELVQDAIRSERENPRIVISNGFVSQAFGPESIRALIEENNRLVAQQVHAAPIPMILTCPICCKRHIDEGEFATKSHHTHSCQNCGFTWRPAVVPTVGVQFLPGFKNKDGS